MDRASASEVESPSSSLGWGTKTVLKWIQIPFLNGLFLGALCEPIDCRERPVFTMLARPDPQDDLIISILPVEYGLHVAQLDFLPIGADRNPAVFRVVSTDQAAYFLKLT